MSMAQLSVASGRQRIAVITQIPFQRLFRLAVLCPTTGFTFWMIVWSLLRLGEVGSFTSLVLGLGEGMWVVGGWVRSALLRIALVGRGVGCTAAGTWRAGGLMGCWSLWGARTSRLRFAGSELSLGRSRLRCLGRGAYRRLRLLRAGMARAGRSLSATWLRRLGGRSMRLRCVRMLVCGCRITWFRLRLSSWIVFR